MRAPIVIFQPSAAMSHRRVPLSLAFAAIVVVLGVIGSPAAAAQRTPPKAGVPKPLTPATATTVPKKVTTTTAKKSETKRASPKVARASSTTAPVRRRLITRVTVPPDTTKPFTYVLRKDQVLAGDAYDFNQQGYRCVAYMIAGPGTFSFFLTDGIIYEWENVTTAAEREELLAERVKYLSNVHPTCKYDKVHVVTLPL